jgi:23S rRNA (guanosine2251-2'-O)-methyltransferase
MAQRTHRRRKTSGERLEWLHGRHVIEGALSAGRRRLHRLLVRPGAPGTDLKRLIGLAQKAGLPIVEVDPAELAEMAGSGPAGPRGAVLEAGPLPELAGVARLCEVAEGEPGTRRFVVLDGVEDPQNVGTIARVSDAAGAGGLILTRHHSPPLTPAVTRASAGAIEWLPVARVTNLARALSELKSLGFWVVAADPEAKEGLYTVPDRLLSGDLAVVLGAEGRGLRPGIRSHVDHPVRIPMLGRVDSLNVATAGAVLLYELLRRTGSVPHGGNHPS